MAGKTKRILLVVLVLVVAGVAAGYFMWNKPHQDVHSAESIKVIATDLYQSFVTDSTLANKKYIDKVVEVTGTVQSIVVNQQNQKVVSLKTASDGAYINCTMEQADAIVKEGTVVTLKGICSGLGEGDAELGILGDIYLTRCYTAE